MQYTSKQLRAMSDEELAETAGGLKPSTGDRFLIDMEVKRRQNFQNDVRGWVAVVISVVSLVIAAASLATKESCDGKSQPKRVSTSEDDHKVETH